VPIHRLPFILAILCLFTACSPADADRYDESPAPVPPITGETGPFPAGVPDAPPIRLATFNVRGLSDRSRSDGELRDIAELVAPYDIVAIQEARDYLVLERLVRLLKGDFGRDFEFSASAKFKSGGGELYAFLWQPDRIDPASEIRIADDPGDRFIREPAWQVFRATGGFDFVLIDYHALFGSSAARRREELAVLPEALRAIRAAQAAVDPAEADFILLGDFNMPSGDRVFDALRRVGMMPLLPQPGTTINDSPYDNIWTDPSATREYLGAWGVVRFDETEFDNDDKRASLSVSDHRPAWAEFAAGPDDD
jgi:endonuclease/exonuclease/phosphatase family metal-dependent hydrolase